MTSGARRIASTAFIGAVFLLAAAPSTLGQTDRQPRPKEQFVASLVQFTGALAGTYGDEGPLLGSNLAAMRQALARWDASVSAYEAAVAEGIRDAAPRRAADLHRSLGIVYLDRGRVEDARGELEAAARLDATRADVAFLLGVVNAGTNRPAEAAQALIEAARLDPSKPLSSYLLARQLEKIGESQDAARARQAFLDARTQALAGPAPAEPGAPPFVEWALTRDSADAMPFFAPARYAEGFALLGQGRYAQALARFEDAAASDPLVRRTAPVSERIAQGAAALRQGQVPSAVGHLQAVVQMEPNHGDAHRILGTIYWAAGRRADSLTQLEEAVRLNPDNERARMALADVLVAERRLADAARVLEDAIRAIPGSGQAHYKLGQVSAALQAHPQALDELEEAARLAPLVGLDFLHRAIGELLSIARDFDAILEPYTRRVELNPNNPDAHLELGETYLRLDRNHEAMAEFHAALMIDPRHADAYAVLGQAYHRLGQYAEAALAARRAVALDPTQPDARYTLATSLIRLGRTDEGTQQLETYRQMQTEAEAGRRREYALTALMREVTESAGRGAYDEAAARLRAAIQLKPDEAALHVSLGLALRNAGRLEEAIGAFERAVTLNAGPDVHRYLADVHAALGRPDEAQRHRALFERLRKESPLP